MFFVISAFAAGCARTVYVPQVSYRREVDTLLMEVADSSVFRALLECDSNNRVVMRRLTEMKGRSASQEVSLDDGEIEIRTRWQTKHIERVREVRDTITVVEIREIVKPVRYIPKLYSVSMVIAVLCTGWGVWRVVARFR